MDTVVEKFCYTRSLVLPHKSATKTIHRALSFSARAFHGSLVNIFLTVFLLFFTAQEVRASLIDISLSANYTQLGDSSFTAAFYRNGVRLPDQTTSIMLGASDSFRVDLSGSGINGVVPGEGFGFLQILVRMGAAWTGTLFNQLFATVNTTGIDAFSILGAAYELDAPGLIETNAVEVTSDTINGNRVIENNTVIDSGLFGGLEQLSNEQQYLVDDPATTITVALSFNFGAISSTASLDATYELTVLPAPVPIPAALWLFGSGLLGLLGVAKRKKA